MGLKPRVACAYVNAEALFQEAGELRVDHPNAQYSRR
jgi:hypothetical protein